MREINVTEPYLPPLDEYVKYLSGIWDRNWLTNQGPLVSDLEKKLKDYHQLATSGHCVANGSMGMQVLTKALAVHGEVITTPFSYVATTSCPLWGGCSVKFVDIEFDSLTIDPSAVEEAITPRTEGILATHVYGNPCDVEALESIASKHGVALLFDAAHAFGVSYKGKSILSYGDASMVSLHATKLMHAVEGGYIVAKDPKVVEKIEWMRRFGHDGPEAFHGVGINAKMSELHAAMGLCVFEHIDQIISQRRSLSQIYDAGLPGSVRPLQYRESATRNYSYYPVQFETEERLLAAVKNLERSNIIPRRYFYPLLNQFGFPNTETVKGCEVAESISKRILCLPMACTDNSDETANRVLDSILEVI